MDHNQAYKKLAGELEEQGYTCRLDMHHKHPRMYVSINGTERFVPLSGTANYDQGDLLKIKMQDIKRDVLPHLPKPPLSIVGDAMDKTQPQAEPVEPIPTEAELRSYPIKAYIIGRGNGPLCINLPSEIIPKGKRLAQVVLAANGCLVLIFSEVNGISPNITRNANTLCYRFARHEVPFKYAKKQPVGWKAPTVFARIMGESLTTIEPLPEEVMKDQPTKKVAEKSSDCLADGKELVKMVNEWLEWAEKRGHEPKLQVNNNKLSIGITEKITRTL